MNRLNLVQISFCMFTSGCIYFLKNKIDQTVIQDVISKNPNLCTALYFAAFILSFNKLSFYSDLEDENDSQEYIDAQEHIDHEELLDYFLTCNHPHVIRPCSNHLSKSYR